MIITIMGRTGTGKTTLSRYIAERLKERTNLNVYEYSPFETTIFDSIEKIQTNAIYLINEIQIFLVQYKKFRDDFLKVFTGHRHYNIYLILNSQRPALIDRTITALSNKIYSFQMTEPRDLDYIRVMSQVELENIKNLAQFEFYDLFTSEKFFVDFAKNEVYRI